MKTKCPKCKKIVDMRFPALSRRDNKTKICSDCGTREAFEDYGLNEKDSEAIIRESKKLKFETRHLIK